MNSLYIKFECFEISSDNPLHGDNTNNRDIAQILNILGE